MSDSKIVASARDAERRAPVGTSQTTWAALGWIGLVFLVVGGVDFVLVWWPPNFGSREWEFGTVTQSFNGLPIVLLGVGLLLVASEELGRRWWTFLAGGGAAVLLLWVLAGLGLWASSAGLALQTVPDELRVGIQKAMSKTLVQAAAYSLALTYLVKRAWFGR